MNFTRVCQHLRALGIDDIGSAAIEYAILLGLIAVALISALSGLSEFLAIFAKHIADELARAISTYSS